MLFPPHSQEIFFYSMLSLNNLRGGDDDRKRCKELAATTIVLLVYINTYIHIYIYTGRERGRRERQS